MFEKFLSGNIESFRQRYEGTFGFYKSDTNKRMLVKLAEISPNRCVFHDAGGVSYELFPDSPREIGFEFLPPKSAWYNTESGAMFTQRLAQRQFQRGVTGKTLEISVLTNGQLFPMRVNFDTLTAIYEKAIAPKDAIKALDEKKSLAISGQFALDQGQVFVMRTGIGTYNREGKRFTFTLTEPDLWRTEITDALTAMGCSASFSK